MLVWYLRVFNLPLPIVRDARDQPVPTAGECLDLVLLNLRCWGAIFWEVGAEGRKQDAETSKHETCILVVIHIAGPTIGCAVLSV